MNNYENQKEREEIAFKKFIELYFNKVPTYTVGESPDYIIEIDDEDIGMEICEYMDSKRIQSEKAKKIISSKVLERLNKLNMDSFYEIRFYWRMYNENFKYGNEKKINNLVNSVIEFFCDNYSKEDNVTILDKTGLLIHKYDLLNQYFSNIQIRRYDSIYKKNHVLYGESAFLGMNKKILTNLVEKKEEKITIYNSKTDKTWLLIAIYGEWFSNMVNSDAINELNIHDIPLNRFDRLFILDVEEHTLKEIC